MKKLFTQIRALLKRQNELRPEERLSGTLIYELSKFERINRGHQHLLDGFSAEIGPSEETTSQQLKVRDSSWEVMRALFAEDAHLFESTDHVTVDILESIFNMELTFAKVAALSELSARLGTFSRNHVGRDKDFRWQHPFINSEGVLVVYLMFPIIKRSKDLTSKTWKFDAPATNSISAWRACVVQVLREMREVISKHESWPEFSDTRKKSALFYSAQKAIEGALIGYSPVERIQIVEMWGDLKPRAMK